LTQLLLRLGYQADLVNNGVEVLNALTQRPYDLIFMDVQMPEMDGLTAAQQIGDRFPPAQRPYIIAVTANAMLGDREECLQAGMDDYISKPIRLEKLKQALQKYHAYAAQKQPSFIPADPPVTEPANSHAPSEGAILTAPDASLENAEPELLIELISCYLEETPTLLETMKSASQSGDAMLLKRTAHTLKSTSALMGAPGLTRACQHIEANSTETVSAQVVALVTVAIAEYERVRPALEERRSQLGVGC
ncbi:MAG TPA: response regulator, partial [Crinalium sp.]